MAVGIVTKQRAHVGALLVGEPPSDTGPHAAGGIGTTGSPVPINKISSVVASVTPGAVPTNTAYSTTVTLTGARAGDAIIAIPPTGLEGFSGWAAYVSANDTVTLKISNLSAVTVTGAARNWTFLWIQLT
jgi:hypothetical protein